MHIFGDLSGIVINKATGQLVCAHQRRAAVADRLGKIHWSRPHDVELGYEGARFSSTERLGWVETDEGARFAVREVDWPDANFEQAALLAANNPGIMGDFTEEASQMLEALRVSTSAKGMDDLGLDALLADLTEVPKRRRNGSGGGGSDAGSDVDLPESFQVIVDCEDEAEQLELFESLKDAGRSVKLLSL